MFPQDMSENLSIGKKLTIEGNDSQHFFPSSVDELLTKYEKEKEVSFLYPNLNKILNYFHLFILSFLFWFVFITFKILFYRLTFFVNFERFILSESRRKDRNFLIQCNLAKMSSWSNGGKEKWERKKKEMELIEGESNISPLAINIYI